MPGEAVSHAFSVDTSDQPAGHPPLSPADGAVAIQNPPSIIWRVDGRAATYTLEMCQNPAFDRDVVRIEGIDMPFYNHSEILTEGAWYWQYTVVTPQGKHSEPGPVRRFIITPESIPLPIPPTVDILVKMPAHPRVFATPDTLDAFRARKDGPAKEAWQHLKVQADADLNHEPPALDLQPMPDDPGEDRGQVFFLKDGQLSLPVNYKVNDLRTDAVRAETLSFAYLITGDDRYGQAARRWALFASDFRLDIHLKDRGQHDTVVYCYEYGLKGVALAFDHLYDLLTPDEREVILRHIDYHCEAAHQWIHNQLELHLNYQNSHGQQCMHALFTTVLAVATDLPRAAEWADYLIRQYVNRIAWGSNDGGYTEGQKYGHKVQFILEALAALKTATGIDLFKNPRWRNTGDFWLYSMSLNYWWNHWGDCYSLIDPNLGSDADTYITAFLASMHENRTVKWYSDTRICNPAHLPLWYLASSGVSPKPPVDIPRARLFPEVGQLAAYDRFYDHGSNRIFFRSSPWGSHSHAHCDQNGFILHAGGEILACDAGYYTYAGDTYHSQWSRTTQAHNSILINGQGQPKSIESKGNVSAFFNTPDHCFFIGDASKAYEDLLQKFDRTILFIRPDITIVYDELRAPEPSDYTWVLNTFEPAEIDSASSSMTIKQRDQWLVVQHLTPEKLDYTQNNNRPYPMKTRAWCRFTEAFPQHWNIRLTTAGKKKDERFLAFMHTHDSSNGPKVKNVQKVDVHNAIGVRFDEGDCSETTLFRLAQNDKVGGAGIDTDARVTNIRRTTSGRLQRWLLHAGQQLTSGDLQLWRADRVCDAAVNFELTSAAAQVCLQHPGPLHATVWLPNEPRAIFQAPPDKPAEAKPAAFTWTGEIAEIEVTGSGETVLWVDPVTDLSVSPAPLQLSFTDSAGTDLLDLETAVADNGEIIAFAEFIPREPGVYELTAEEADLLIQDRWDPDLSARGTGQVTTALRESVEVFVRYAPDKTPDLRADLKQSHRGQLINLLCNGSFEAGIPDYPPRFWNVQHPRSDDLGWPGWSREDAAGGSACLKFVRPKDPISLKSRPMRLRTGGTYVLRFKAKGTAAHASVSISGQGGTGATVQIEPGSDWKEYHTELDVYPGYCTVSINFSSGGDPDQVVWVDDVKFGYIV